MTENELVAASVAVSYLHAPKRVRAGDSFANARCQLKWYDLYPESFGIPQELRALARKSLTANSIEVNGLGFVILHRCENDFYFLIVSTWRNENELWETVWYKDGDKMADFAPFRREPPHLPTFCVWELAIVSFEKDAWVRFLTSVRDAAAVARWRSELYGRLDRPMATTTRPVNPAS